MKTLQLVLVVLAFGAVSTGCRSSFEERMAKHHYYENAILRNTAGSERHLEARQEALDQIDRIFR